MQTQDVAELFTPFFAGLTDPRLERTQRHTLPDIIILAVCAALGNANGWADIERFSKASLDFLRTFLDLPNGIPSHDAFGRVFARLDPAQLMACIPTVARRGSSAAVAGEVVAIDGETPTGFVRRRRPARTAAIWCRRPGLAARPDAGLSGGRYRIERNHGDSPATRIARPQGLYRPPSTPMGCQKEISPQPSAPRRGLCIGRQGQPVELSIKLVQEAFLAYARDGFHRPTLKTTQA